MEARDTRRGTIAARLAHAGCIAATEEADELIAAADGDESLLEALVARRTGGEPLAWVTGSTEFAGLSVRVRAGVYVPRWQTEMLVRRAIELLPERGLAADICTGSGAVAAALGRARPMARVVATDIDPLACACARENGVEVFEGNLADPLPDDLRGHFDVLIAVTPYVPTEELVYLPRDVREHEPPHALDGGHKGVEVIEELVGQAADLLAAGGVLLLELGGDQDETLTSSLKRAGFGTIRRHVDEDGDLRGIETRRSGRSP